MDRLSELPDAVLTHILSFLPTKDSIKTTLLSKRFLNLWLSVPNLLFHHSTPQFINQTLLLWPAATSRKLDQFHLHFTPTSTFNSSIRLWIRFALQYSVQNLRLLFNNSSWEKYDPFSLPQHFYSNTSIQTLELGCCVFTPNPQIHWPHLNNLSLTRIRLTNEIIKNLICGSLRLEVFAICNCKGYDSLVIDSVTLKTLKIFDNHECSDTSVTISAPNITKLCIGGVWYRKVSCVCLTALVDAEIGFLYTTRVVSRVSYTEYTSYEYRINEYVDKVVQQLHCLHSIERLVIDTMCIEALTLAKVKTLPPQLSNCRSLTLRTNTETNVLKGILNLVKMLPNLEVLILNMEFWDKWYAIGSHVESFLTSEVEERRFLFQHLKVVKITSHVDRRPALPFIKFLLEHARALETMSISPKTASSYSIDYMFQLIQDLSDMPRSSPIAKVVLQKGLTKIQVEARTRQASGKQGSSIGDSLVATA